MGKFAEDASTNEVLTEFGASILDWYQEAFLFDLSKNSLLVMKSKNMQLLGQQCSEMSWPSCEIQKIIDGLVSLKDKEAFLEFIDKEHIRKTIELETFCFEDVEGSAKKALRVAMSVNNGKTVRAMLVITDDIGRSKSSVDALIAEAQKGMLEERKRRVSMQRQIHEILEFLGAECSSIILVDLVKNRYSSILRSPRCLKLYPGIQAAGFYDDLNENVIPDYVHPKYKDKRLALGARENLRQALKEEKNIEYAFETAVEEGEWERVVFRVMEHDDAGEPTQVLMIHENIDHVSSERLLEMEAIEEAYRYAEEANQAKTEFLSRVSHDIRTPMNGIIGMTAIARINIKDRAYVLECLDKIEHSSKHLLGLVNEILDFNTIREGKESVTEEEMHLSSSVQMFADIIQPLAHSYNHTLEITNSFTTEAVMGDSQKIMEIFTNIAGNAIKYTPSGGYIRIAFSERESSNRAYTVIEFTCEDNGVGMDEEFLKKIYEPFARAKNDSLGKREGVGLGLPITRNLVRLMHGEIQASSTLGKGTKFSVLLPLRKVENCAVKEEMISSENKMFGGVFSGERLFVNRRVLLVEDNEINALVVQGLLDALGVAVDWAESGKCAIKRMSGAAQGHYDMIFMDIQMPEMNGYEAARAIRKIDSKDAQAVPIIALSADVFPSDIVLAKNAGMNEHLAKPIDAKKLEALLHKYFG